MKLEYNEIELNLFIDLVCLRCKLLIFFDHIHSLMYLWAEFYSDLQWWRCPSKVKVFDKADSVIRQSWLSHPVFSTFLFLNPKPPNLKRRKNSQENSDFKTFFQQLDL